MDIEVDEKEADLLFDEFDTDNSDGLDLSEFQSLVRKSNQLNEWAKTLNLSELLADAIPRFPGRHPLRIISTLTDEEQSCICLAVQNGLKRLLKESSESLKASFDLNDERTNSDGGSKFNIVALSCGNVEDFHKGIEGRIGAQMRS